MRASWRTGSTFRAFTLIADFSSTVTRTGPASVATFDTPWDLATDKNGNLYVADLYNNCIRKVTPHGTVSTFAGGGYYAPADKDGQGTGASFYTPGEVAVDPAGAVLGAGRDRAGAGIEPQHTLGDRRHAVAAVLAVGRRLRVDQAAAERCDRNNRCSTP